MQIPSLQHVIKRVLYMIYFSCMVYFYYSIQQIIIPERKKGSNAFNLLCERPEIIESTKFAVRVSNINITSTSQITGVEKFIEANYKFMSKNKYRQLSSAYFDFQI